MKLPSLTPPVEPRTALAGESASHILPQGCDRWKKMRCAGTLAACSAVCYASGVVSSACISCMGSAYNRCKDCL